MPLLLSDPVERRFISWFEIRKNWVALFEDSESLLFYTAFAGERILEKGDSVKAAIVLNGVARVYIKEGSYLKGSELSQQAYEIARNTGDSITMGWAQAYLAEPFVFGKAPLGARAHLEKSLAIARALGDRGLEGESFIRLGAMYAYIGDFEKLLEYNERALAIGKEHKLPFVEMYGVLNICFSLNHLGRQDEAITLLGEYKSWATEESTAVRALMAFAMFENLFSLQRIAPASRYLDEACKVSNEIGFFMGIGYCKEATARLYERGEDHLAALAAYKDYHKFYEAKVGEDIKQKLRNLEKQQQISRKDREIEKLEQAEKDRTRIEKAKRNKIVNGFLLVLAMLLSVLGWVYARKKINDARQQKKIAEVKLQVLKSQMNPHFIFNALNGIQNYILKSEKIEAYSYLNKFGDLLRMITNSSASTGIELEQEFKFLKNYLEMEKLRFRDQFDYHFIVAPELLECSDSVPSMMIQPIIENAIQHGLSSLSYRGKLTVTFITCKQGVKCVVVDNGRGREVAAKTAKENHTQHLSIASVNTKERLEFLRKIGYVDAKLEIEDMYLNGKACGTTVIIYLPFLIEEDQLE